ncbi:cellulose biosynthesis cyclic di-GMP-binding regulatory protein BcsB [Burkholderia sp. BDU5]|uniref:cellulose biosynthesis cyclic di-GMP-binding regulatory protein BcsB n=1 Tax=Burkholderia sp. BDU5 TaxID=1385590 RepID=UPI0007545E73|nr:cellulose biosynthesis cyclic di-GMP-binding regulatory protein BcsB [Burkholderia sp. BDU5]KVE37182.1 cellulose synthase [Burkholderia sp. BDU5]
MKPIATFASALAIASALVHPGSSIAAPQSQSQPPQKQPSASTAAGASAPLAAPKPPGLAGAAIRVPFATLGAYETLRLRGSDTARTVNAGVRLDRMVTAARLRLTYTYSPSLVFPVSHLKVSINGESVATLPFDSEHAGRAVTQEIPLDPRYFTDFNQIELRLIAHYTLDHCEDPEHSALWADVSPTSELIFDEASVRLPNDLALLPAPFFDRRDNSRLRLPFVLPATPDDATLRSAGVLASWFGALADYRQARFPVSSTLPANDHAVIVGAAAQLPASLQLPPIDGPMLVVADNPVAPDKKLLVVTGRSAADVDAATNALVLGNAALSGPWARVSRIDIGAPRKPYDAPRWVPVNRPVTFRELIGNPADLQVRGSAPDPVRLNLRLPADLHSWSGSGVPLSLHYRYTAPTVRSDSMLAVEINDQLVQSYRLSPRSQDARGRVQLPLLSDADSRATNDVDIPAFRVGSANQLQLRFTLDSEKTGLCTGVASEPQRAAIDPDSTIDFSRFIHYATLPNLAYFANSGFPFTRYADLSQTAIVLPERPSPVEQEAFLTMLGHMGQWTGFPALRMQVARTADAPRITDKDLLVIDGAPPYAQLSGWRDALPVAIGAGADGGFARATFSVKERWRDDARSPSGGARFEQSGALAALFGFELPGSDGRSVVAMTATDARHLGDLLDVFEKPGLVAQLQGDVALVRAGAVESMRVGEPYLVSYVPWYARVWTAVAKHPVLLGLLGAAAGLLLALGAFGALQRIAARRRGI